MLRNTRRAAALMAAGLLSVTLAMAADTPTTGGRSGRTTTPGADAGGGGDRGNRGGTTGGMRGGWLDEQQRQLLGEARQKHASELQALDEKMREAQKELSKVLLAEKFDEKAVREKAEAVAKIQVEQTVLRAKIFSVVVPTLKPEQREQIESNPWALTMLLGGGFGGDRGGFGGPGGFGGDRGGMRGGPGGAGGRGGPGGNRPN